MFKIFREKRLEKIDRDDDERRAIAASSVTMRVAWSALVCERQIYITPAQAVNRAAATQTQASNSSGEERKANDVSDLGTACDVYSLAG